jgi:hemolysin III
MSENQKRIKRQKKEQARQDIRLIKEKARNDVLQISYNLKRSLVHDNPVKLTKLEQKEIKRKEREEKRIAYESLPKRYTILEEIWNSITHGIGAGLSIAALVILVVRAVYLAPDSMRALYVTGYSVFGSSLILLYLMSTLYHALTPYGAKKVFSIFDHSSIYILIAGTYTPYCLTALQGATGWTLFGIIWALAVLGVVFYAVFGNRLRFLSVIMYILMGWLIIFAINPMKTALSQDSLVFLVSGGAAYTVGVIFYALKKVRYAHCIWHLFVLAGSILHFFSLFLLLKS